ncbi:histidinol dehydrogenase [Fibrobacter sp. UWEL]|uniref:histidinol dehydrogenase n=1 Tax=Fibrobacter sp. UWEL TaxID=1896209 RepID=UPI00091F325F|nr:histidinol dehydrogenase [Fibrobacter sp. UWEL]SHK44025.1 histidinol dehydrogenase [Fibrobacter sp. UWEL]
MQIVKATPSSKEIERICGREVAPSREIYNKVVDILADIKKGGYAKAVEYAQKFDGLKGKNIRVSEKEIEKSAAKCPAELQKALKQAIKNVRDFHKNQMEESWLMEGKDGVVLGQRIRPMKRVGLYVPGGAGIYPSTVIMNAVPAIVAGVQDIVVVTPIKGEINRAVAFVLKELGVTEVYHIGGAQAIGLLAYGAKDAKGKTIVERVDKIVGPGNVFAAVAKKEVFGVVDIDMVAGPSEVLVMADRTADPDFVAADLLSQAEHGSGFEAAICITDDMETAQMISACVDVQVENSPKRELLEKVLNNFGRILVVKDWFDGVAIANKIAPEHLEVMTDEAESMAAQIENAGAVFIGHWSSEPVGDYFAGPNHVLPTNGTGRFFSPLGVYDFLKRMSIIRYSEKAIKKNGKAIAAVAMEEGFYHHAQAVLKRL